jgi:hypothetical protein
MEFKKERGQRGCRFARVEKDGTVWCTWNEWVCGISEGSRCPNFQPTLAHFGKGE